MPLTTTTQRILSTTWLWSKGLHWNRPMTTSMLKYTYRSELQGIPSKLELHAIPISDRNIVLHNRSRTDDHNKPSWNQIDFVNDLSHRWSTRWNLRFQFPGASSSKKGKELMLAKHERSIIHPPLQKYVKETTTL